MRRIRFWRQNWHIFNIKADAPKTRPLNYVQFLLNEKFDNFQTESRQTINALLN